VFEGEFYRISADLKSVCGGHRGNVNTGTGVDNELNDLQRVFLFLLSFDGPPRLKRLRSAAVIRAK
jgi:hypothetical protein